MSCFKVVVVDYGMGNLLSVRRGLEYCGASVEVSNNPEVILSADRVVLPGVGAFANAISELKRYHLDEALLAVVARGAPLLGICLGMQLLLEESEEFCHTVGLGLIPGRVVAIPKLTHDGYALKVPYVGWTSLSVAQMRDSWRGTLFEDMMPEDAVYFVHSYMAEPDNPMHRVANYQFGDFPVSAAIQLNNVYGCQFHPEKSGAVGLKILQRFLSL